MLPEPPRNVLFFSLAIPGSDVMQERLYFDEKSNSGLLSKVMNRPLFKLDTITVVRSILAPFD